MRDNNIINKKKIKRQSTTKIIIFCLTLIAFFLLVKFTPLSQYASLETLKSSKDYLRNFSENWWFPLLFVLLYIIGVIISFPGLVLTVSGGLIFGTVKGTILNLIAANIGASITFFIGRYLGRDFVEKLAKGKLKDIDEKIEQSGFMTILRLRLIPLVPFNMLNYASGFSKIKYYDYAMGTLIGMLPGTFIYTFFADSILIDPAKQKETFIKLLIASALLISASFIPNFFKGKSVKNIEIENDRIIIGEKKNEL